MFLLGVLIQTELPKHLDPLMILLLSSDSQLLKQALCLEADD